MTREYEIRLEVLKSLEQFGGKYDFVVIQGNYPRYMTPAIMRLKEETMIVAKESSKEISLDIKIRMEE